MNNAVGGYSGIGAMGITAGIVDTDPVTPGIQYQSGVLTQTLPPRIVGGRTHEETSQLIYNIGSLLVNTLLQYSSIVS